jgi:hypothetical protein
MGPEEAAAPAQTADKTTKSKATEETAIILCAIYQRVAVGPLLPANSH